MMSYKNHTYTLYIVYYYSIHDVYCNNTQYIMYMYDFYVMCDFYMMYTI